MSAASLRRGRPFWRAHDVAAFAKPDVLFAARFLPDSFCLFAVPLNIHRCIFNLTVIGSGIAMIPGIF
jgi:hypothetical protein